MLDDEERSVLEETERALTRNDPDLARRLSGERPRRGRARSVVVVVVALVLIVGLLWLGLPGQALVLGLLAGAVLALCGGPGRPSWAPPPWLTSWRDG